MAHELIFRDLPLSPIRLEVGTPPDCMVGVIFNVVYANISLFYGLDWFKKK